MTTSVTKKSFAVWPTGQNGHESNEDFVFVENFEAEYEYDAAKQFSRMYPQFKGKVTVRANFGDRVDSFHILGPNAVIRVSTW